MVAAAPALLLASAAAATVGTGIAVAGQMQQAESDHAAGKANQAIAEQQAELARTQATQERRRAAIQAEIFSREARRRQGLRVSQITSSGITLSGSSLDVLADAALNDEEQRLSIIHEGEQRAHARQVGANIEDMSAAEFARQASAERTAGRTKAAGTLIGGFSQTGFTLSQSPSALRLLGGG